MHSILTADLAAILSHHGHDIAAGRSPISSSNIARYWSASRSRLDHWHAGMAEYRDAESAGDSLKLAEWWHTQNQIVEDVFVDEMLTRVVAALGIVLDSSNHDTDISSVTHAVYEAHLDVRIRVQKLMLFGRGTNIEQSVRLNRLRKAVERWIDVMVGRIVAINASADRYAIDSARSHQHASEYTQLETENQKRISNWLMTASMRQTLAQRTKPSTRRFVQCDAVSASVIRLLRPDRFDDAGLLRSLRVHYLMRAEMDRSLDTSQQWEQLLNQDSSDQATGRQSAASNVIDLGIDRL